MNKSTVCLLIIALASAGVSAGLWLELRAERALNAELSERLHAAAAIPIAPRAVSQRPAEPPTPIAPVAAVPAPAPTPVSTTVEPAAPGSVQGTQEEWRGRQRQMMNDPKYREAFREQQRLRLATRRDNLIRVLGFSPEQADAVIDLSIDREMNVRGNIPLDQALTGEREYDARLRELLGEDKSAKLQTYMESRQSRMQVDQFRIQLTGADSLRDDQVEPLIAAMHVERSQMQRDLREFSSTLTQDSDPSATHRKYSERETELLKETYDRMGTSAAAILSSTQLLKLDAMLKRDIERREAQQRMSRIQSKLAPPREVAGNSN